MFSLKILSLLIISSFFLQCMGLEKQVHLRGKPEEDYPTYYAIPKTSFRCSDQLYNPGFYADTETRCQVFHYCYEHRLESFLCPLGTVFNQPILACDYWYSSNCSMAPSYYSVNAIKRNDEADDTLYPPSEDVFDKMADLYEINKTLESPDLKNDSITPESQSLSKDTFESSSESLVDKNIKTENYNKYSYDKHFNIVDEKQPEIVKYELVGSNAVNIHKDSENEQPYKMDNAKDFIFSDDGKLHPSDEDIYQMSTDMNFDEGYSDYSNIPSEQNFNYDLNEDFDYENDFQIPDFELQKRYYDLSGNNVRRRPSHRKPIIIIPEAEPEIVELPVAKPKRKPIRILSTVSTIADKETSYEITSVPSNNEETTSMANTGFDDAVSSEFPLIGSNLDPDNQLNDPKLIYEFPENIEEENDLQIFQTDNSYVIYDYYGKKKTRTVYVLPNNDEDKFSTNDYGSGYDDLELANSKHGDDLELFTENLEGSIVLPDERSDAAFDKEIINNEVYLGSGSEETIISDLSSDGSNFLDHQHIFSNEEDTDIDDMETSHVQQLDLSNTIEGSGTSDHKTNELPGFVELDGSTEYLTKHDYEGNFEFEGEPTFSKEALGEFTPSEDSENNKMTDLESDGSGSNEFNYIPHELQESVNFPQDGEKIREIDGEYYVFSDPEHNTNHDYDLNGLSPEHANYAVAESFEDAPDEASEGLIDSERPTYVPEESNLKIDHMESETLHSLSHQDSSHLEDEYKQLSDEFEAEISSDVSEEYTIGDYDVDREFSTEDLKYLEVLSQTPIPILKNLFDVSEVSSSNDIKDEIPHVKITPSEQNINDQTFENPAHRHDNFLSDISSEDDTEPSDIYSEILDIEEKIAEETSGTNGSDQDGTDLYLPKKKSVEKGFIDISDQNGAVFHLPEKKIVEETFSNIRGSDQEGTKIILPEMNSAGSVSGMETDSLKDLFLESDVALTAPENKLKLPLTIPSSNLKFSQGAILQKDKLARGKRLSENIRTFNPPNKSNPLTTSSKEAFREAAFTSIPSTFLKMKHSTLRPYFYNYGVKNSGFNPRTGNSFESSKLSKLSSIGRNILAAKSAKFNLVKKYIDSYRNI